MPWRADAMYAQVSRPVVGIRRVVVRSRAALLATLSVAALTARQNRARV
jgi:hypothetical protein